MFWFTSRQKNGNGLSIHFWKVMVDIWFFVAIISFSLHFFSGGVWDAGAGMISIIYPAVLTIFASEKEVMRWRTTAYASRFSGEFIVIIWTVLLTGFVLTATLTGGKFRVSWEMVLTYIAVLSVFAITKHSKILRRKR